jgi:hypothetical protein
MPVTATSFSGQVNGSGSFNSTFADQNNLFLKLFAGEVLTAYETATVMKPLHMIRTISSGKTAQFPVTGIASASYFKPGTDIASEGYDTTSATTIGNTKYLTAMKHAERTINIDDLLIASTFVDKLDEMKNHYDVRSIYSAELGRALARTFDKNLLAVACLTGAHYTTDGVGTSAAGQIPGGRAGLVGNPNGTVVTSAYIAANGASTNGDVPVGKEQDFIDDLYEAAAALDKNNVPSEDRYTIVTPTTFYRIINSEAGRKVINRDFGGGGSYQEAKLAEVAGIRLVKSNIAGTVFGNDVASVSGVNNSYSGNFKRVMGVVFQKSAFGTVKLMDLSMETNYEMRLQGHLMVAKYAMGSAWLRPECCVVIANSAAIA